MQAAYYDAYPPMYSSDKAAKAAPAKEDETDQVAASFLLSLKHSRSVTPEPSLDDSDHRQRKASYQSYSPYNSYCYDTPYADRTQSSRLDENVNITSPMTPQTTLSSHTEDLAPYESLIGDSELVLMKDRDLVPDALFVAMAQMKPCRLTHADRVGCYKSRELGFLGMCCKHCGGQPGFGRYYPNSVRSLAQTTTSQTILKHIGNKCRFCPSHIRNAVVSLQQQNNPCEGVSSGRPRYGSRKIFFQRVWSRLHNLDTSAMEEEEGKHTDDFSTQTPTDIEEEEDTTSGDDEHSSKRKNRFGGLPLQKNKRFKATAAFD